MAGNIQKTFSMMTKRAKLAKQEQLYAKYRMLPEDIIREIYQFVPWFYLKKHALNNVTPCNTRNPFSRIIKPIFLKQLSDIIIKMPRMCIGYRPNRITRVNFYNTYRRDNGICKHERGRFIVCHANFFIPVVFVRNRLYGICSKVVTLEKTMTLCPNYKVEDNVIQMPTLLSRFEGHEIYQNENPRELTKVQVIQNREYRISSCTQSWNPKCNCEFCSDTKENYILDVFKDMLQLIYNVYMIVNQSRKLEHSKLRFFRDFKKTKKQCEKEFIEQKEKFVEWVKSVDRYIIPLIKEWFDG